METMLERWLTRSSLVLVDDTAAQPGGGTLGDPIAVSVGLSWGRGSRGRADNLGGAWGRQTSSYTLGMQQRGPLLLVGRPDN